ncbi:MAG: CPBP family intramembrane metalloprotease, partial [Clostridium sp.]|nr:CPBP family intramembrane metalloprotease [Clostridium sp.]
SSSIGISKLVTAPVCMVLTVFLYLWVAKNGLKEKYGLCKFQGECRQYLYFIPLVLLVSVNLWWGFRLQLSWLETALSIFSMLCVGFLEEVIFRGFLFQAICKKNVKRAIIISGVTFGFGHIVNLLNGRDIPETLLQICYATAIGILFTIIFYKGKSLWPCIITHSVINSLSVFANEDAGNMYHNIVSCVFLCVVSIGYTVYILKKEEAGKKRRP